MSTRRRDRIIATQVGGMLLITIGLGIADALTLARYVLLSYVLFLAVLFFDGRHLPKQVQRRLVPLFAATTILAVIALYYVARNILGLS